MSLPSSIDFIAPTRWPPMGWALLAAGLCALVPAAMLEVDVTKQRNALQEQIDSLQRVSRSDHPSALPAPDRVSLQYAGQIQSQLLRPWDRLFTAIEAAYRPEIGLLSIEPDARQGTVLISGQAPAFAEVAQFLQRLRDASLTQAYVMSHQRVGAKVSFKLSARWDQIPRDPQP